MPVADRHIGELDLEVVPGEARAIRLVDLDTEAPGVTWTATAGPRLALTGSVSVDSGDVVVSFAADLTARMIGQSWRLLADGQESVGGSVLPARPQTEPGTASVPVLLVDESTVTVTVVTGVGGGGAPLSDDDPEALAASAAPGAGSAAARADHVHPRPTAGEVGADPAGSASTAQAAAISAAATDATTKANAAQAAAVQRANHTGTQAQSTVTSLVSDLAAKAPTASPTFTGTVSGVTKSHVGLGNVDNTADTAKPVSTLQAAADAATLASATDYTDDEIVALMEPGAGIGTKRVDDSGIDRVNISVVKASPITTSVATGTETSLLTTPLAFAAGVLSINSILRFTAFGQFTNNTAATRDVTFRLKFGSHPAHLFTFSAVPQSATPRTWVLEADIGFFEFFGNRCEGIGRMALTAAATAGTAANTAVIDRQTDTTGVVTPASASTVDLTVQLSATVANLTATITGLRYQHVSAA
jgi:hypothetical protein